MDSLQKDLPASWAAPTAQPTPDQDTGAPAAPFELPPQAAAALDLIRSSMAASPKSAATAAALLLTLLAFPRLFFPLALFALGAGASAAYLYLFLLADNDNDAANDHGDQSVHLINDDDDGDRTARSSAKSTRRKPSRSASRRASLLRRHSFQHPPPPLPTSSSSHPSGVPTAALIESVSLDLDAHGPLDLTVSTLRDLIIRDFVQSWFATSLAAPGPGAHRFPTAIAISINTLAMKLKARLLARGTADLLVDLTTRAAGDLVAHLRMVHPVIAGVPVVGSKVEDKVNEYAKRKPASAVARAVDADEHAKGVRRVAERLLKGLLPVQDAHSPIVYPIVEEIVCTSVLWPVVNMVSDPHFINGLIVGALDGSSSSANVQEEVGARPMELNVRVIQTRAHNDTLKLLAEQDGMQFYFTVLFRGAEKRANAHGFGEEGSSPGSFVVDSGCPFSLKSPLIASDTAILQLCRSSTTSGTQAVVAEALVPLLELPHVGWTPFYDLGAEGDDLVPVMELWIELEVAEMESASPTNSASTPVVPAAELTQQQDTAGVAPAAESELSSTPAASPLSPLPSPPSTPPRESSESEADRALTPPPAAAQPEPIPEPPAPRQDLIDRAHTLATLTLATLVSSPTLTSSFTSYLQSASPTPQLASNQLAFLSAATNYAQFTSLLDPSDPQSRAAIQQEAYDVFDTYFSRKLPVLPSALAQALEERIVLDPTPGLFDPAAKLVGDQLQVYVGEFARAQARAVSAKMTDAELVAACATAAAAPRPRPRHARSPSVSLDDRPRWTPVLAKTAALAVRHAQLVEGKCSTLDVGFAASCLNTMQMQLVVLERLLAHAMMQSGDGAEAEERVSRLMMAKSRVECGLMALEPIVFGSGAGGFASLASMDAAPAAASVVRGGMAAAAAGGIVGGLTSGAQSIKAGVGMTATKSVLGVRNVIKGVGKGSLSMTSKFMKRKVSNLSLASTGGSSSVVGPSSASTSPTASVSSTPSVPGTPAPSVASSIRSVPSSPPNSRARLSSISSTFSASSATLLSSAASSISESGQQFLAKVPSALTSSVESITSSSMSVATSVASTLTLTSTAPVLAPVAPVSPKKQPAVRMTASPASASPPPIRPTNFSVSPGTSPTSAVITAIDHPTGPSTLSTIQADALIESTLAIIKQVFALDGTLRARIFSIITQVLRPTLASHIQNQFVHLLDRVSDPEVLAQVLEAALLDPLWPNGTWHANVPGHVPAAPVASEEKERVAARARELVEAALPEVVARVLGKSNAASGVRATFGMVQVAALNKGLVVDLLETVAEVVVPEELE